MKNQSGLRRILRGLGQSLNGAFSTALFVSIAVAALTGCGNSQGNNPAPAAPYMASLPGTTVGTCQIGYVYSSTYGCLQQGSCPSGEAMYGGTCIVVTGLIGNSLAGTSSLGGSCPAGYTYYSGVCISTATATSANMCQGSCPAGYNQTAYGCLPQYTCNSCDGYYGGYCFTGAEGGSTYIAPY